MRIKGIGTRRDSQIAAIRATALGVSLVYISSLGIKK